MGRFIALSGVHGAGKSTVLRAIAPILNARVVTLPSPRVVPGLPPDAPARVCRDAALQLGLERGRLALLADCLAAVEDARGREGLTLASCCALDTAAHQGPPQAIVSICGPHRPDLVVVLDAAPTTIRSRIAARGGEDMPHVGSLVLAYHDAVTAALFAGWRIRVVNADRPIAEVVDEVLAAIREVV